MLPLNLHDHYSYKGSMSSPPCTENVYWFVLAESVKLSKAQVMRAWCRFAEVPPLDFPVDESTPPTLTSRDT